MVDPPWPRAQAARRCLTRMILRCPPSARSPAEFGGCAEPPLRCSVHGSAQGSGSPAIGGPMEPPALFPTGTAWERRAAPFYGATSLTTRGILAPQSGLAEVAPDGHRTRRRRSGFPSAQPKKRAAVD